MITLRGISHSKLESIPLQFSLQHQRGYMPSFFCSHASRQKIKRRSCTVCPLSTVKVGVPPRQCFIKTNRAPSLPRSCQADNISSLTQLPKEKAFSPPVRAPRVIRVWGGGGGLCLCAPLCKHIPKSFLARDKCRTIFWACRF